MSPDGPVADPSSALQQFRLDGRVAVVTGASSGLGRRFAEVLHSAGARVFAAARREHLLDELAAELERVQAVACDVASQADVERLVAGALEPTGAIDVLVNAAGASRGGPAASLPVEDFEAVVAVNLTGTFRLCRLVGGHMVERGAGSIVNIASMFGLVAATQLPQAGYTASKAGVVGLTRELADEWGPRGVRVNAIAPGFFPTALNAGMWGDRRWEDYVRVHTPLERRGRDHELDGALLFLASDASSYVTGQVLSVDGGWTAR